MPVLAAVSYILPLFVVKIGPWANDIGPGWLKKLDYSVIVTSLTSSVYSVVMVIFNILLASNQKNQVGAGNIYFG